MATYMQPSPFLQEHEVLDLAAKDAACALWSVLSNAQTRARQRRERYVGGGGEDYCRTSVIDAH